MSLDLYQSCVCGSGKKVKFCSCGLKSSSTEFERIIRLVNADQNIAALDRINSLLKKTPNSAWLLALKARIQFLLSESDGFVQTAERFVQLKPTNPLALALLSLANCMVRGKLQEAARALLDSLAEANGLIPQEAIYAIATLSGSLSAGKLAPHFLPWESLALQSMGRERVEDSPIGDPFINLLLKSDSPVPQSVPTAPWSVRYEEAENLVKALRHSQAEAKLRSILRDHPHELVPLMRLFEVQRMLVESEGLRQTAHQLSVHPELPDELKAYYRAFELLLTPNALKVNSIVRAFQCPDMESVKERLAASPYVASFVPEVAERIRQRFGDIFQEEVAATFVHMLLDRPLPSDQEEAVAGEEPGPRPLGYIVGFGKQVDQPARLIFSIADFRHARELLDQLLEQLPLGEEIASTLATDVALSLTAFLFRQPLPPVEELPPETLRRLAVDELPDVRLLGTGERTMAQLASDADGRVSLQAILMLLEGEQQVDVDSATLDQLYQRFELQRPTGAQANKIDAHEGPLVLGIERCLPADLDDQTLMNALTYALSLGAIRAIKRLVAEALDRESIGQEPQQRLLVLQSAVDFVHDSEKTLDYLREMREILKSMGKSPGPAYVYSLRRLVQLGRVEDFQQLLGEALNECPDDPALMSLVRDLMEMNAGTGAMAAPASTDVDASRPQQSNASVSPEREASRLVIPGAEPKGEEGGSNSGLWLPGQ
ncbi:MAG: protein disulfide-isomerase [Pirellulaceae bacterium]|nr:MAG: protein disulfide-isomerase [Pirellulaceae bacterium]